MAKLQLKYQNDTKKAKLKKIIIVASVICAIIFIPWVAVRAWLAPVEGSVGEQVEKALDYKLDGIIVYVDQRGKAPSAYAGGWKDKTAKMAMSASTLFKIASISKLYIAAASTRLICEQKISLDDTLGELLPELSGKVQNADKITFRMLLQHRSGIPDWINQPEFPWNKPPDEAGEMLDMVIGKPADFLPDDQFEYSNTNYLLVGRILDRVLGYSHTRYIRQQFLDRLKLKRTFGQMIEADTSQIASGYDSHYDKDVKKLDFVAPGSSMVSTAEDVGIFLRALNDGTLLSKKEKALFSTIQEFGHTGLLPGYQSIARYHKDIDAVVVQFVNTTGGDTWTTSEIVYNKIVNILRRDTQLHK